jgi:DNA-directed RNA polymerase subunit N (RpoN/RPB10)
MEINCLSCGHKVDIGDAYDDYEGKIKCYVCGAILEIKTEEGNLKLVMLLDNVLPQPSVKEAVEHTL